MIVEAISSALIVLGACFMLLGSIGLVRLPELFSRLHAPTKAATLGIGAILLGSIIQSSVITGIPSLRDAVIALFIVITAPVAAHLLAKAALKATTAGKHGSKPRN